MKASEIKSLIEEALTKGVPDGVLAQFELAYQLAVFNEREEELFRKGQQHQAAAAFERVYEPPAGGERQATVEAISIIIHENNYDRYHGGNDVGGKFCSLCLAVAEKVMRAIESTKNSPAKSLDDAIRAIALSPLDAKQG